ncbi:MAG: hypothetical protein HF982_06765 [Desulfobacteraceae bacterium]|nr:hypothetical protein [Desulfobacteraceae bacterium]MBC2719272.1 hypothetical protein [Desulfobacteraceae bacterium]
MFESIFQLDGNAFVDSKKMVIELEMNLKETELMTKLNKGLCVLYMLNGTVPKSSYVVKSKHIITTNIYLFIS